METTPLYPRMPQIKYRIRQMHDNLSCSFTEYRTVVNFPLTFRLVRLLISQTGQLVKLYLNQEGGGHSVTKADIVEEVYERVGISKQDAARLTELFLDIMKETSEKGEKVEISGFGNFIV